VTFVAYSALQLTQMMISSPNSRLPTGINVAEREESVLLTFPLLTGIIDARDSNAEASGDNSRIDRVRGGGERGRRTERSEESQSYELCERRVGASRCTSDANHAD